MKKILLFAFLLASCSLFGQSQLNFDGYQDHVVLNGTDLAPPWTVEVLVRKNQQGAYSHLLTGEDGTSGIRLEQYINNNRIGITAGGVADWQFSSQAPVGEWMHLAIICNGALMQLFVDGQPMGIINSSINAPLGLIGLNTTGAGALNAKIDELRIWNTTLPQSSIEQYQLDTINNTHPQYDQLVHYYNFNEGSGDIAHDSKGDLDGTVVGATFCPVVNRDIGATALISPAQFVSNFSSSVPVIFKVSNNGTTEISEDFTVQYAVDNGEYITQTVEASANPIASFSSYDVTFPNVDLSDSEIHTFEFITSLTTDGNTQNDTLFTTSSLNTVTVGDLTEIISVNGEIQISSGVSKARVRFYRPDVFRIEAAPAGIFRDNTNGEITVHGDEILTDITLTETDEYHLVASSEVNLRVYKSPLKFAMYNLDDEMIWEESEPLSFGQRSTQKLRGGLEEHFYGCGMQNGYFAHKNKDIAIRNIYGNWGDGTVPNPAPFYMSTAGYGVYRNTYQPGQYSFYTTVTSRHDENRFDAYYFAGEGLKDILEGYTYVTGRPFMMPRWGMEFGDADCYNDTGTTADVIDQIAVPYRDRDMPGGWILPNDGYSCGYENLEMVVDELDELGFYTGLWTEDGVGEIAYEVGTAGSRAVKLDVALVGPGYQSAFNTGLDAFNGIEDNSNDRGFVWTVAGWAGTQRFATPWSGDQEGDWENIRFHIPTVIGSGLSGFNAATGDIDGIYGGSGPTFTRDLQWKCFTPAMMTISGWASAGKQPWSRGEPYTSINREYLKLKMRLTPYLYKYSHEAHQTGVPTVRAMVLEFPDDPTTYDNTTQYQFMSGESLLVAPVYENSTTRNNIYLPQGTWIDYWDGTRYEGPMTLNGYDAPLDKLPLFVKKGAIIPMYPEMLHDREKPKDVVTYDVYPGGNTSFNLYEDDGHSKDYRNGDFAETLIEMSAAETGFDEPIVITVGATEGSYADQLAERNHLLQIHSSEKPKVVTLDGTTMTEFMDKAAWEDAAAGWYFAAQEQRGIVYVKTDVRSIDNGFTVRLEDLSVSTTATELLSGVAVFPNPTTGILSVTAPSDNPISEINVFNVTGQLVKQVTYDANTANTTIRLPETGAMFFVEVTLTDGASMVERVILRGEK